jgi:plastocyanin
MNAFVIAGLVLAGWAVLVGLLGMRGFPKNKAGQNIAIGITAVLFVGAVGSAIADQTKVGERHGAEVEEEEEPPPPEDEGGGSAEEPGSQQAPSEAPADPPPGEEQASPNPQEAPTGELTISADEGGALKYDVTTLTAPAGQVTITMDNPSPVPHNVAIRGENVDEAGEIVQKGDTSTAQADLGAGEYEFLCTVPGHADAGMKGVLTVE